MFWRVVKIILVSLVSLTLLAICVVGIALNYLVTPERVTPIINHEVSQYLDGEASIGKVDITPFSSFPDVSITIDSLVVRDTLQRSLAEMTQLRVTFNPIKYLKNKELYISELAMIEPSMTIARGADGLTNVERIFSISFEHNQEEVEVEVPDSVQMKLSDYVSSVQIGHISVENGYFRVLDRITRRELFLMSLTST